jgi:hypothetical protein
VGADGHARRLRGFEEWIAVLRIPYRTTKYQSTTGKTAKEGEPLWGRGAWGRAVVMRIAGLSAGAGLGWKGQVCGSRGLQPEAPVPLPLALPAT